MKKPDSLRAALVAALPDLASDPDKLLVFIDNGAVHSTSAPGLSFECSYTLHLILTDFAGDPDLVWIALLMWVRVHQSELMDNETLRDKGIAFEADILDNGKADFSIKLPLTERIVVKQNGDAMTIDHASEPQPEAPLASGPWKLYLKGHNGDPDQLIATWNSPPPPP